MRYLNKKIRKLLKRIRQRQHEGDENKDPYSVADDVLGRKLSILSRGGFVERSHKSKVGRRVNKDLDKKFITYKALENMMKRIESSYNRR